VAVNAHSEIVVILLYCTLVSYFGRLFKKFHKSGLLTSLRRAVCHEKAAALEV